MNVLSLILTLIFCGCMIAAVAFQLKDLLSLHEISRTQICFFVFMAMLYLLIMGIQEVQS